MELLDCSIHPFFYSLLAVLFYVALVLQCPSIHMASHQLLGLKLLLFYEW